MRQQVGGDDGGVADVGLERILQLELDEMRDAGGLRVGVGFLDAHGIDVDAQTPRSVFLCRGDQDSAIAAAQIDDEIVFLDVREGQHAIDDFLRRWRHRAPVEVASGSLALCLRCRCDDAWPNGQKEAKRDKPAASLIMFVSIQNPV